MGGRGLSADGDQRFPCKLPAGLPPTFAPVFESSPEGSTDSESLEFATVMSGGSSPEHDVSFRMTMMSFVDLVREGEGPM